MKKVNSKVVNHWETLHREAVELTEEGLEQRDLALKVTLLLAAVQTRGLQRSLPTQDFMIS